MTKRHALIAGAGIGGLTAALCLARNGWRVTLLERAPVLEEVGAGLQLSPNASRVLKALGVLQRLEGYALAPKGITIRRGQTASRLAWLDLQQTERQWGVPYMLALRCDLQRALIEAVAALPDIQLLTGHEVAGFGVEDGRVKLAAKKGLMTSSFEADCLIGADGIRSFVRSRLLGTSDDLAFSGYEAWRALAPTEALPQELRRPETNVWLGPDAHVVHYPLRQETVTNIAVIIGRLNEPERGTTGWSNAGDRNLIARRFKDWHPLLQKVIAAPDEWLCWPLYERATLASFSAGPIALLGDAAHPMLPFLAQGAAQAIEDAAALAQCLQNDSNVEAALGTYSKTRLARATKVQQASKQQGRIYHLSGAPALARDIGMRVMGAKRLLARNDWIYQA